jgi:hypothetical protein
MENAIFGNLAEATFWLRISQYTTKPVEIPHGSNKYRRYSNRWRLDSGSSYIFEMKNLVLLPLPLAVLAGVLTSRAPQGTNSDSNSSLDAFISC